MALNLNKLLIKREKSFKKLSKTFGKVDKDTQVFRDKCKKCGFDVVFADGISKKDLEKIIESEETQNIINSKTW
jgi:hypothetical protein